MHILQKIKVLTSNPYKRKEFEAQGLAVIDGDVREVQGTPNEVILYKALAVEPFTVVEDTITVIDKQPIVDWKTSFAEHAVDGKDFTWQVRLAFRDESKVYVFEGEQRLQFFLPDGRVPTTPHFDDYCKCGWFEPELTLEELKQTDKWRGIDPRARALYNLTWHTPTLTVPTVTLKPWTGEYQQ